MKLLLDTHALLWWLSNDNRLGPPVRNLIGDPANDVLVSVVSLWEIVVKVRVGKLRADIEDIVIASERSGFLSLNIGPMHLRILSGLARHHGDPFDHLLTAQAIAEHATFISDDRNTTKYDVNTMTCSGGN
jgi:PIN domain nuclease of toxin-antitoxin system